MQMGLWQLPFSRVSENLSYKTLLTVRIAFFVNGRESIHTRHFAV